MPDQKKSNVGVEQTLRGLSTKQKGLKKACYQLLLPIAHYFDRLLSWSKLNAFLATIDEGTSFQDLMSAAGRYFQITIDDAEAVLATIPKEGPLVIVSNHPTGFLETILLPNLIMQHRPDLRVLANEMLGNLHGMSDGLITMNVFKREDIKRVLSTCTDWLSGGGVLLVFPSGEVADFKKQHGRVRDGEWSRLPVTLARKTNATIINCHLNAKNTRLFGLVSRICMPARVIFLMRELYQHSRQTYTCSVAQPLAVSTLSGLPDAKIAYYLHALNECLPLALSDEGTKSGSQPKKAMQPVQAHQLTDEMRSEIDALTDQALLYKSKKIQVFVAKGSEIPSLLHYIQAVRELIFREVDMGSGEPVDADSHDQTAMHVIVWDTDRQQLVASSRCQVMSRSTPASYLNDMYEINSDVLFQQGDLFAVSRTFVSSAYQKSFSSLLCLWRGMAQLVLRFETVRFIAGVVSISSSKLPRRLFDYLSEYVKISATRHPVLASVFSPKEPYQRTASIPLPIQSCLETIESVAQLENFFSEMSGAACQLPVLFRQYESLGTVPLSMSVDSDFSLCVDVLQVWDTHEQSEKIRLFFRDEGVETLRARAKRRTGATS